MRHNTEEIKINIPSKLGELSKIEHISGKIAKKMNLSEDQKDNLSIAVTEAVGNAIVHGNKKDPKKYVSILFQINEDQVKVTVSDEGGGFDPDEISNPLDPENIMKESGRGIFILKALMDEVSFNISSKGTTIQFSLKKRDDGF
jgi:serine/threonine-protein kinase RsbW